MTASNTYAYPDAKGHFGPYGGSFVSETLTQAISELKDAYAHYQNDPEFVREFESELKHFVGRPSPVYHAARMSADLGGARTASLPRRARANTAWQPPPFVRVMAWNAWSIWAASMWRVKRPM